MSGTGSDDRILFHARELASAIRESDVYRARDTALLDIERDAEKKALLAQYSRCARELQINELRGLAPSFDEEASLGLLYSKLCVMPQCRDFLEAQAGVDVMLASVYEILDSSIQYP